MLDRHAKPAARLARGGGRREAAAPRARRAATRARCSTWPCEKGEAEALRARAARSMARCSPRTRDLRARCSRTPRVSAERKRKLVAAVAARAKASELLTRLLDLLGERDRLELLPDDRGRLREAVERAARAWWRRRR